MVALHTALRVDKTAVCRFLLAAQGLTSGRPPAADGVPGLIRQLECVQIDPVAAVERNQHLVLAARHPAYQPAELERLLLEGRVFEYDANAECVIPMEDYPVFSAIRRPRQERLREELEVLGPVVPDVLARLEAEGPLPARAIETDDRVSGYWDGTVPRTKATSHALNLLLDTGRIMVVRREGSQRFFDLTERAVPPALLRQAEAIDLQEAQEALMEKYLRAFRVFDTGDFRFGWRKMAAAERQAAVQRRVQAGTVVPLEIEGVRRRYYMLVQDVDRLQHCVGAGQADAFAPEGKVRFLPPLDNLLWRRERVEDLFGFQYTWEVYLPPARRRYGYYAMPILAGDRLIGRLDPRLDREQGMLHVRLLQLEPDVRPSPTLRRALRRALEAFARFHQAREVTVESTAPEGLRL